MENPKEKIQRNQESRFQNFYIVLAGCVLAFVMVALIWVLPVNSYLAALLKWTESLGFWGPVVVVLAYIIATVLFLPGSVLTLVAGFLFGVLMGTVWASIGSTLGAAAERASIHPSFIVKEVPEGSEGNGLS